jgi:FkbM family methyltransferase
MVARIRRKNVRFAFHPIEKELVIIDGDTKRTLPISFARRYFSLYRSGFAHRSNFLKKSYCINSLRFANDDVVVDCGANSGDLALFLNVDPKNYIAFEPSPVDYQYLKKNYPESKVYNCALGEKNANLKFFVNAASGDSSIVEPPFYSEIIEVQTCTLDSITLLQRCSRIKLLKVEAEGYEPEVLYGAIKTLEKCDYVAVDGGFERGKSMEQTLPAVINFLLQNNFEIVDIYYSWSRALFKNKSAK